MMAWFRASALMIASAVVPIVILGVQVSQLPVIIMAALGLIAVVIALFELGQTAILIPRSWKPDSLPRVSRATAVMTVVDVDLLDVAPTGAKSFGIALFGGGVNLYVPAHWRLTVGKVRRFGLLAVHQIQSDRQSIRVQGFGAATIHLVPTAEASLSEDGAFQASQSIRRQRADTGAPGPRPWLDAYVRARIKHAAARQGTQDAQVAATELTLAVSQVPRSGQTAIAWIDAALAQAPQDSYEDDAVARLGAIESAASLVRYRLASRDRVADRLTRSLVLVSAAGLLAYAVAFIAAEGARRGPLLIGTGVLAAVALAMAAGIQWILHYGRSPQVRAVTAMAAVALAIGSTSPLGYLFVMRQAAESPAAWAPLIAAGLLVLVATSTAMLVSTRLHPLPPPPLPRPSTLGSHARPSKIADQMDELRGTVDHYGRDMRRSAQRWRAAYIVIGLPAVALAGAAGVSGLADVATWWTVALALGAASLSALSAALNPGRNWEAKRQAADACESLSREIAVMRAIDLGVYKGSDAREALEEILGKIDNIIGIPDRVTYWAQWYSRKSGIDRSSQAADALASFGSSTR
jgi:hypothetical protein